MIAKEFIEIADKLYSSRAPLEIRESGSPKWRACPARTYMTIPARFSPGLLAGLLFNDGSCVRFKIDDLL